MKKIVAMLLVILMLTVALVSCKKDENPDGSEGGGISVTTPVSTDPNRIPPETKAFGGYEFKFLLDQLQEDFEIQVPDEIGSDGIRKILVERNKTVEALYNVKITQRTKVNADGHFNFLDSMDRSQEYFADIYSRYAIKMVQQDAVAGFYLNLCELNSLRLDQAWWDQDFNKEFTINNHLYTFTGDIQTNDDLHEILPAMNLDLYNQTYPDKNFYDIVVKNGAWTFDEFYETWYGFGSYDGGTPGVVDASDKVGYFYDCRTASYMYMASGLKAVTIENNKPVLSIQSDKALRIMDNLTKITDAQAGLKSAQLDHNDHYMGSEAAYNHFAAGKALFVSGLLSSVLKQCTDMEDTVVHPPFPKYDGEQDRYYNLVHMCFEPYAISSTVEDPERSALITEALAFYSEALETEVMKVLLKERLTSELETREILQLTLDSKVYDLEYTANIMGWTGKTNDDLFEHESLDAYKSEMDSLARAAVNGRGSGKLELFLTSYAGLKFKK